MLEKSDTSLVLRHVFAARPEELFRLWTDPAEIVRWHRPDLPGYTTPLAEVDLRVGGTFKIGMRDGDGTAHTAFGTFTAVEPPRRVSYTWQWEGSQSGELSQVTVEFKPVADGTELVLHHERLSGPESVAQHAMGWQGCFHFLQGLVVDN